MHWNVRERGADPGTTGAEGLREDLQTRRNRAKEWAEGYQERTGNGPGQPMYIHAWMCGYFNKPMASSFGLEAEIIKQFEAAATQRAPVDTRGPFEIAEDEARDCVACPTCQTLVHPDKLRAPVTQAARKVGGQIVDGRNIQLCLRDRPEAHHRGTRPAMKDTGRKGKAKFKVGQVVIPRRGMFGEGVPAKVRSRKFKSFWWYQLEGLYCDSFTESSLRIQTKRERGA